MRMLFLFLVVFMSPVVFSKTTIVEGGVIHFRGEIVEGPCEFSYQSKNRKVTEQCGNKDPIAYKLNKSNSIDRAPDAVKITGYEIIPNKAVILKIIYP